MKIDWSPLHTELQFWHESGLVLPLWWRDDDAIAPSDALSQLADLSDEVGVPVHLAVIPKFTKDALVERMRDLPNLIAVMHGFAHDNHAPAGQKKAEFGANRAPEQVLDELHQGQARLQALFAGQLRPMFVPPWNRIDPSHFDSLVDAGFTTVSTFTPRAQPYAAPGLLQINTHLDPIAWHAGRGLVAPQTLIAQLCSLLQERRVKAVDNNEPLGILTHHLVHDAEIWDFTRQMLRELRRGPIRIFSMPTPPTQETST